jgi:chromosome partitioning protein
MIVLCTHHKGGVGKTELAIHVAGILRKRAVGRTLLLDCDRQASAWWFHLGQSPDQQVTPRRVDPQLTVLWNPDRVSVRRLVSEDSYDHIILDVDVPLANTVQTIVQSEPNLILVPVNLQGEAIPRLAETIPVCAALEQKTGAQMRVRIVPLGAKVPAIRRQLEQITPRPRDLQIVRRVRDLHRETNRARTQRIYSWDYPGCDFLAEYYRQLVEMGE